MLLLSAFRISKLYKYDVKTVPNAYRIAKLTVISLLAVLQLIILILWSSDKSHRVRTALPSSALSFICTLTVATLSWMEHRKTLRPSTLIGVYLLSSIVFGIAQVRTLYIRHSKPVISALLSTSIGTQVLLLILESKAKSSYLKPRYQEYPPEATAGQSNNRYRLAYASAICFKWKLLKVVIPRCSLIGFSYAQPFLINRALRLISQPKKIETTNYAYGMIAATGLVYLGIAISTVHYKHEMFRIITMFRGSMVHMIYSKTLRLRADEYDESAAITLMSTDVDRIAGSLELMNEVWARLVEIGIDIWLLQLQLGWVCVAPIIIVLVCFAVEIKIASFIGGTQVDWVRAIQRRVGITSTTLRSMRSIKMMGLVDRMSEMLQGQRIRELQLGKRFRWLIVWLNVVAFAIRAEVEGSDTLSTLKAFTSLSIINLVTSPAIALLASLPVVASALGCFDRISKFLNSPELEDHRLRKDPTMLHRKQTTNKTECRLQDLQPINSKSDEMCIFMNDVDIRPSSRSQVALHHINLQVTKGSLTMILGPIGSGKSTLVKAILGELPCENGSIQISASRMAYCSQTPWLLNTSIRDTICGASSFDLEWYERVVYSCVLSEDIAQLPHGDASIVGSQGIALSGGQKQRIIIVLSSDGSVEQDGSLDTLKLAPGFVSTLMSQPDVKTRENPTRSEESQRPPIRSVKPPTEEQRADLTRRTGDFAVYSYYLKTIGVWYSAVALAIISVNILAVNFPQIWLMWYSKHQGRDSGRFIGIYVLLAVLASSTQALMIWQIMIKIVPRSGARLHRILLQTVMRAPMSFFAKVDSGVILNRFSQDMTLVDAVLPSEAFGTFKAVLQCLAQLALISLGSSYVAIAIIPSVIVLYLLQMFYLRTSRQLRFLDLEAKSPLYSSFIETLEGLSTIRTFGWQSVFQETHERHLDRSQRPYYLLYCIQIWLNLVLELMTAAIAVVVMALAMLLRDTTSPGVLGVSLTSVMAFTMSLQDLINSWTSLETSLGAVARTKTFEHDLIPEDKPEESFIPPSNWPDKGLIEVLDITASYSGDVNVLQNIAMTISPGEQIGICGRSGSGKSSLVYALLRLLDLSEGRIILDGIDISTVSRNALRSRLIVIPQDPVIIAGSIRLNIDPLSQAPDNSIMSTLQKLHLWETIQSRGGLDADITDQPLSRGEQQLLAVAGAILRKENTGKVLVLDEATSSVDSETDTLMRRVIREEFVGYTVVAIAHRLGTIRHCTRLAVLDRGRLAMLDTPERVLEAGALSFEGGDD
ncbi:ABC multidrug transporter [Phlyctema vagabunda]|uniref:ABC multidrug transporter n=1 Tax=Phlyctema vagabunda TaxID=108571 RepID=A0ABR4P1G6_9HELO